MHNNNYQFQWENHILLSYYTIFTHFVQVVKWLTSTVWFCSGLKSWSNNYKCRERGREGESGMVTVFVMKCRKFCVGMGGVSHSDIFMLISYESFNDN